MRKQRDKGSIATTIIFSILLSLPTLWLLYQSMQQSIYKKEGFIILLSTLCVYALGFTKGINSRDKEVIRLAKEADELEDKLNKMMKETNK